MGRAGSHTAADTGEICGTGGGTTSVPREPQRVPACRFASRALGYWEGFATPVRMVVQIRERWIRGANGSGNGTKEAVR